MCMPKKTTFILGAVTCVGTLGCTTAFRNHAPWVIHREHRGVFTTPIPRPPAGFHVTHPNHHPPIHRRHEPPPHLRPLPAGTSDLHPGSAPSPRNRHPLPKKTTFILGAPAPSPAHFSVTAIATHPNHHPPIHRRHEPPPHLRPLPAGTSDLHPGGHHVRGMHPGVSRHSGRFALSSRVTSRASSRLSYQWTFSRQTPPALIDVRFDQSGSCAIQS